VKIILLAYRRCPTHTYETSLKDKENEQGGRGKEEGVEKVLLK